MTPLQFAKANCSNYQGDGSCAGIGIQDTGQLYSFGPKPKCVLGTSQRCFFFEECVMGCMEDLTTARGQQLAKEHDEARRLYRRTANMVRPSGESGRLCPQCKERELEPRRRLCYICSTANKRQAKNANRQNRGLTEGS